MSNASPATGQGYLRSPTPGMVGRTAWEGGALHSTHETCDAVATPAGHRYCARAHADSDAPVQQRRGARILLRSSSRWLNPWRGFLPGGRSRQNGNRVLRPDRWGSSRGLCGCLNEAGRAGGPCSWRDRIRCRSAAKQARCRYGWQPQRRATCLMRDLRRDRARKAAWWVATDLV
jgi:hypothetical protein